MALICSFRVFPFFLGCREEKCALVSISRGCVPPGVGPGVSCGWFSHPLFCLQCNIPLSHRGQKRAGPPFRMEICLQAEASQNCPLTSFTPGVDRRRGFSMQSSKPPSFPFCKRPPGSNATLGLFNFFVMVPKCLCSPLGVLKKGQKRSCFFTCSR